MRLYSYSSKQLTLVDAKWVMTKFVITRILIGTVILFGLIKMDYSLGNPLKSRSPSVIAAENDILRQQLSVMSPRVSTLEMQVRQLHERANEFHVLLGRRSIVRDTVSRFTNAAEAFRIRLLIPAGGPVVPAAGAVKLVLQ